MSFATFVSETATVFSAPDVSTIPSRAACASNGSAGAEMVSPVSSERIARTRAANSGWVLRPVPTAVPPRGTWPRRGRLAHVHVVVRVHVLAGERREHLVRIHVRRGARPRLEDVDRKLVVELAVRDPRRRRGDALRLVGVEQAEVGVRARSRSLDATEPARNGRGNRLAGDGEVHDGLRGLTTPELLSFVGPAHPPSVGIPVIRYCGTSPTTVSVFPKLVGHTVSGFGAIAVFEPA